MNLEDSTWQQRQHEMQIEKRRQKAIGITIWVSVTLLILTAMQISGVPFRLWEREPKSTPTGTVFNNGTEWSKDGNLYPERFGPPEPGAFGPPYPTMSLTIDGEGRVGIGTLSPNGRVKQGTEWSEDGSIWLDVDD